MEDNYSKLYRAMVNSGYDAADLGGNEEEFRSAMQDSTMRKNFYDWASKNEKNGFRIGSYESYEARLAPAAKPSPAPLTPAAEEPRKEKAYTQVPALKAALEYDPMKNIEDKVKEAKEKKQSAADTEEAWRGVAAKMSLDAGRVPFRTVDSAAVSERLEQSGDAAREVVFGFREQPFSYKTTAEKIAKERMQNVKIQDDARDYVAETMGIKKDDITDIGEYTQEGGAYYADFSRAEEKRMNKELNDALTKQSDALYQQVGASLQEKMNKINPYKEITKNFLLGIGTTQWGAPQAPDSYMIGIDDEQTAVTYAAARALSLAKGMQEAAHDDGMWGNFLEGALSGLAEAGENMTDAKKMNDAIATVVKKWEEGGETTKLLNDDEKMLLDALAYQTAVASMYQDKISSSYNVGRTVGAMLPFAVEFLVNPASGLGRKTASQFGKYALKRFAKNTANKYVRSAIYNTGRGLGRIGGSVAGGAAMTATTGLPKTVLGVQERMLGRPDVDYADGKPVYTGQIDSEEFLPAVKKEVAKQMLEYGSEMLGAGYLDDMFTAARKLTKGTKGLGWIDRIVSGPRAKAVKSFMERTGWNGPLEEFLEEVHVGYLEPYLVGDTTHDKFFTPDNLIEVALGVAVPGTVMSTAKTIAGAADGSFKAGAAERWKMDRADRAAVAQWGAKWESWRDLRNTLMVSQPEEIEAKLKEIAGDNSLTGEQKMAAIDFGIYSLQYRTARGVADAMTPARKKNIDSMLHDIIFDARSRGYEAVESEKDAGNEGAAPDVVDGNTIALAEQALKDAETEVRRVLALSPDADVEAAINGRTAEEVALGDEIVAETINAYTTAKAKLEGMQDTLNKARESDRQIDETANDGVVYATTLSKTGEKIFITSGKVVLNNEGFIDVNQSEKLVALMPDSSKKFVKPGELREKIEVSNAEELKAAKRAEIVESGKVKGEIGNLEGEPTVAAGESVSQSGELVPGAEVEVAFDGNVFKLKVEGRDERGDIILSGEGASMAMPESLVLDGMKEAEALRNGKVVEPADEAAAPVVEAPKTALEQIPRNEKNVPLYEQVDSELAWDGVVEEAGGNEETAMIAVNSMIADKQDALKKAEKAKAKAGVTITEKIAAENERVANIERAKADLAKWEEIAGVKAKRALVAEAESKRVADEAAAKQRAEEERLRAEREAAERAEREALNGVPDMVDDKPQDARARGYRRVNGHKVDRQEPVRGLMGKEVAVKFSDSSIPTGRVAVIEAEQLQPSHIQGQRNPLHFIDEAQPKERNDAASVLSARKIAENVRPEEITSSVTAYTGAPTVNARGEAVQGNNRSAALRLMWENNPEQAAKYKQYLMDHAAEFGLNAEEIAAMKSPVLVNMLDVSDADAITLGQYVAQDTESGGTERIKPKNVMQKMGGDMRSFANKLLASNNEEASFAELVDANGVEVLKWMAQKGYITPTQYKSAFDSKGNLTAEVKNDLRDVMYQSIFKGGSTLLEEMFNALPAKAQKAILATAFRDYDSPSAERMNGEVQNSIRAYYALARDAAFANAKNYKEAKEAAMMWARQYQLDDVSGESFLPSENFSNFAIELAIVYKGWTQRNLQNHFNNIYDLVQGTKEASLFEEADNTPRTLKEAIKETFNIDYNGQSNSNSLAIDSKDGQARKRGGNGDIATGERIEGGERPADSTGGTRGNGEVSSPEIPNNQTRDNVSPVEGVAEGEVKTESGEVKTENAPSEADAPGQSGAAEIKEPTFTEEVLENGDKRITNYNSRGEIKTVATERDGKIVSVDSYDEGVLFETTTYDGNGVSTSVTRYDKNGNVIAESKKVEKIEDVGEVLAGARKDELKIIASSFENATVKSLVELPFSKAFKKPDLKKAVESGALREEDAVFYEAMFNALVNSSKPKNSTRHRNAVEKWAEETYNSLQLIKSFVEADEAMRDRAMADALADKFPAREEELAVIEQRKAWNARNSAVWGDKTTPNPVWVTHEVLKALGYKPGDKVEIPFGTLKANVFATGYEFYNKKGDRLVMQAVPTVEEGIEQIVWLSKIKRGDADTMHPVSSFFATPTKRDMGDSGRYYVLYGTVRNPKRSEFGSKEEADAFAANQKEAVVRPIQEVVKRYGYKIAFRNPLTGDKFYVNDMEFETEGEAMQYIEENYDAVNEQTNELLAKERGETKKEVSADDLLEVAMVHGKDGWKYAVNIKGKYANNMGMPLSLREFNTRDEAKAFLNESKNEVFEVYKKQQAEQKKFVFFDTGENSRIGEDYRGGRDVAAQDFMDTFGFRGVQFGNWTNQADRQMAVNQAYDAFLDLAKLLGVSPKALSLNGELGMAFGSRGSGFGNAHYEPGEIVINLTKTRGAGSLAHEWWHALDNYFARRANVPMGMVTDSRSIDMRPELRQAYNELLKMIENSDFYKRSKAKGDYWGRMHEVTARLMAEWVDQSLKDKGELNTFLSRGVNEERYKRMNYDTHRAVSLIKGKEPMSYEEFEKTPEALAGFPYPSREELKEFGDAVRNIFDTVEEQETENGKVALFQQGTLELDRENPAFERATENVRKKLEATGVKVELKTAEDLEEELKAETEIVNEDKTKVSEIAAKVEKQLEELRSISEEQTLISETDNPTSSLAQEIGQPSPQSGGNVVAPTDAKVNKKLKSSKDLTIKMIGFLDKIKRGEVSAEKFPAQLVEHLGVSKQAEGSEYIHFVSQDGEKITLRLSDHHGNARNIIIRGVRTDKGVSIVISLPEVDLKKFKTSKWAKVDEYVYELPNNEQLYNIGKSIFNLFNSGEYVDLANAKEHLRSPKVTALNKDGTTYGWAVNGEIYLTPEGLNPNTPIHEYTHLWAAALQKSNPKLWGEVVEAMKLSPAWNEVMADDNYTDIHGDENRVASEVLSRLSGNEGYRRYMEQAEAEIAAERNIGEKVRKKGALNFFKRIWNKFRNWLQSVFKSGKVKAGDGTEAKAEPWDVFVNKSLKDFDEGVNPDAKDSPLDRMFIGKKGAENLDKAEEATTRLDNLNVAREMETGGKDAKAIKLATGWERGADGKWRYETEDVKVNRGAELFSPETYKSYPIAGAIEIGRVDENSTIKLTSLVKDDELFKAYPEMEEYYVSFEKMPAETKGSHSFEEKMIRINKDDISGLNSTLVHEIQHAIQSIEGFARGRNTESVATRAQIFRQEVYPLHNKMLDTPEWAEKQRLLYRWLAEEDKTEPDRDYQAQLQKRIEEIDGSGVLKEIEDAQAELIKKYGYDRNVINVINEPYSEDAEIWNNLPDFFYDKYDAYKSLAGEVEARNAQKRLGYTMEQRRNELATETEDVSRKDQIFILDNLGVSGIVENSANFVSTYKTEDGKDINYTSERAEGYGIQGGRTGNSYDGTGNSILQRQTDTGVPGANSGLNADKGEFCVVERVFTENGAFNFTSGEKIESADDVAYIFSALEDAAKEHSFVVYVKDGKPTVVELGMGSFNATMIDIPTASLAYSRINPDHVYFVHNHPSGNLVCSGEDVAMLRMFEDMSDVPVTGVIINLKTGKYGTFDTERHSVIGEKRVPKNEERLTVHTLDKQIFAPDYDPMAQPLVRSSQDVAQFLNSQRMGDRPKVSFLILSRANRIIGNIHTPFTDITTDTEAVARYINERVIQFGGENAILYGDFAISHDEAGGFRLLQNAMERFGKTKLLDVVRVEGNFTKSANDYGFLYEPEMEYNVAKENEERYNSPEQDIPLEEVKSQPLSSFKDMVINKVLETSAKNKENLALRSDALRMFGRDVANVLKLMGKQREYDKSTVDQLVKLAKMYFKDAQLLGGLTPYQVGRVMTRLNNAVGKRDITDDANELVNILVDAHNKELENMLEKQAKTKAKKVNASGVEVIGKLDKEGQLLLEEYNSGKELDLESIDEKIIDLQNEAAEASGKLEGENGEVERETAAKIRGLELARQYREEILAKQTEIKGLEQELKSAEQDAKDGAMDRAAYKEFRRATERAILESKLEMVDAYHGLIHGLGGDISSSAKRAKLFQQAQIDHVKEIQHNANSDLQGHPAEAQGETPDKWNSAVPRLFMSAMPTFQTMLKFFGEKAADGRGYLYERFIPQHTQASHNEYVGKTEAREKMRDKLTEIFGKKTTIENFMDMSRKDGAVLEYQEGGEKKTIDLTRGQVLYLYMINKMADGQMKLSRMGITDADVQKMAKELPEEFVKFADWVQEDFLTELRDKYNAVHERMFGAPMAAIESYFPIKINKRSRGEKVEPGMNVEDKPSTVTGSVIKRTKNAIAIDLSADAMQVLLGHIDDMENWAAWAEFRRDVKSLLNYRHFQNQVKGMESLRYGSGEKLWKNFVDVANIAAGSFKPSSTAADRAVRNIAKGVVSSKIAFRYFTALKQILSTPAFWSEVDFGKMMNAYLHQKEAWDWAMKNLPGFSKRWEGRASGNEILLESDADWKVWQNRAVQWLSNEGMRANAFIDALTVATGAKAVFETKYEMFKKAGYSEERAREKALNRAAEAYNESQQSSESAYLSPLQAEATFVSSVLTAYRNSPFGYNRKMATAIANLKKKMKKGFKQESIDFMIKQLMRDGLNEEQAKKFAKSTYRRSVARDAADVALYEFFLNYVWVLGPSLIYILGGDDDEKKKDLNVEALIDGVMGGLGNLPAGETLTGAIKAIAEGDVSNFKLPQAVAMQDMETIADLMQTDPVRAAGEVLNILVAMGAGVNPQTFTDMYVALSDVDDFSPRELTMLAMRLINAPNSKLELLEADEAMENYGEKMEEITREYAEYQKSKRAPLTGWMYGDESEQKAMERYEKRFKKILDERLEAVVENTAEYEDFYNNADPLMRAKLSKLRKAYLEGNKKVTFEKLEAEELVKKTLYGAGYDDINTVYYELSNAQDEDMALMINEKLKELKPLDDEFKRIEKKDGYESAYKFYQENQKAFDLYDELAEIEKGVSNIKKLMKDEPEDPVKDMADIRELRTKAIDLINNYNE